ncbi:DNA cytosine methyltransferase [Nakamurella antarctica]|uniref:DNA (cytosine-5-)-methyltransferase n=1 Tax=Nakamurella antarctica TaxID=1902245 RepID=A0A3G8ZTB2_9ACTN|nr:DNA cytosine methyltransferase [Nakamurella antarctica]AZI57714.1 DNA cytosine methyltransferase [Nakamurella antarctica]
MALPRVVSLFSGAGGLDLGFQQAGFELAFAVDNSAWAIKTHQRNFKKTKSVAADLIELQPAGVLAQLSRVLEDGVSIGVIGGPPCQGFSRANPAALATDPRNNLPILYLEIVEALQEKYDVQFVLFENVVGIKDLKHETAFKSILAKFLELGLTQKVDEYCALDFGVPQNRRRVIISAFASPTAANAFAPQTVPREHLDARTAISGLPDPAFFDRDLSPEDIPHHPNHWTMRPISKRFNDPDSSMNSSRSFRRLAWDKPSPTVAYGHREIHIHPDGRRRLSIYEAMRFQGFPHEFVLEGPLSAQVEQVSNAVPPPLAQALAHATIEAMDLSARTTEVSSTLVA